MKIKLSPLNILSSILVVSVVYLFVTADNTGWRKLGAIPLIGLFMLSFITDVIFRRSLKGIKQIWIVEMVFIIFAAILILIIQHFVPNR
jgi:hypothetical protein